MAGYLSQRLWLEVLGGEGGEPPSSAAELLRAMSVAVRGARIEGAQPSISEIARESSKQARQLTEQQRRKEEIDAWRLRVQEDVNDLLYGQEVEVSASAGRTLTRRPVSLSRELSQRITSLAKKLQSGQIEHGGDEYRDEINEITRLVREGVDRGTIKFRRSSKRIGAGVEAGQEQSGFERLLAGGAGAIRDIELERAGEEGAGEGLGGGKEPVKVGKPFRASQVAVTREIKRPLRGETARTAERELSQIISSARYGHPRTLREVAGFLQTISGSYWKERRGETARQRLPAMKAIQRILAKELDRTPFDAVGALRRTQDKLLRMAPHARKRPSHGGQGVRHCSGQTGVLEGRRSLREKDGVPGTIPCERRDRGIWTVYDTIEAGLCGRTDRRGTATNGADLLEGVDAR